MSRAPRRDRHPGRDLGPGAERDLRPDRRRAIGLVTPYLDEIQERIVANYAAAGFACAAERHLGDPGNHSFADYDEALIAGLVREVAAARPDAITVFCTNFRGAAVVEQLEAETGIPIYDTVATAVWQGLRLAGADPRRIRGFGRLFHEIG